MTDPQIVRAVVAWAIGFLILSTVGVGVPVMVSFVPDAFGYGRRHGDWKPLGLLEHRRGIPSVVGIAELQHR